MPEAPLSDFRLGRFSYEIGTIMMLGRIKSIKISQRNDFKPRLGPSQGGRCSARALISLGFCILKKERTENNG